MVKNVFMPRDLQDAELVAASVSGDRQAFGQIVERYQTLICSIAYNATGSLAQSQDLAQETFLAAWSRLTDLREPARLRAWLCGIARNRVNNFVRRGQREATSVAEPLEKVAAAASPEPLPVEAVISREEEAILWRSLEQIPDLYREPLILFYREHQSVERVAVALELSEDVVRQRLSRGRKLLQEHIAAFVEGALRRSAPGKAFTLGIIAALPALATSATAATIGAAAAKGTATAKAAAGLGLSGAVLGPILGILGGYLGAKSSIENTDSPRERQFMVRMSWMVAVLATAFALALGWLSFNAKALVASHPALLVGSLIILIVGYVAVLLGLISWSNRRQQKIRREEAAPPGAPEFGRAGKIPAGFEYRSKAALLGLPLVHVKLGNAPGQGRRPAKGWIAIGDTAIGVLFASGGVACGGIALGGLSLGVISIAGVAFGALAFGGWAMGLVACGGGAVAWHAAFGGLAVARDYALGGLAIAQHANDAAAREFVGENGFLRAGKTFMGNSRWLVLLAVLPLVLGWQQMKRSRNRNRRTNGPSVLFLIALFGVVGCQRASAGALTIDSLTLTNGIRVVSIHFPGSANAAIFTYLPMGLSSDRPRQAQWSHLVEHLVIRSTIPENSPSANAETLPDHMRLDFYGSTGNWQEGLEHTADWLRGVPFTQQSLDAEKPKVNSECDFTVKNFATHKFALAAWAQGYRHGQNQAALKGDVSRATLHGIQKYRDERLAVLTNVVVCAVGGIEPAKLLPAFAEKLETIRSNARNAAPVKTFPGNRDMTWDLDARHLVLTWPTPSAGHADYPALIVAAQWLNLQFFSDGELKKLTGMVFAGGDLGTPEGNVFYVSASLRPGASFAAVREKIDRHLEQLTTGKGNLSLIPTIGRQSAASLTTLPDPTAMKSQLPPNMTTAMLEMNIGLQWGMNEFRYGSQKEPLARRMAVMDSRRVAEVARAYLAATKASTTLLGPAP